MARAARRCPKGPRQGQAKAEPTARACSPPAGTPSSQLSPGLPSHPQTASTHRAHGEGQTPLRADRLGWSSVHPQQSAPQCSATGRSYSLGARDVHHGPGLVPPAVVLTGAVPRVGHGVHTAATPQSKRRRARSPGGQSSVQTGVRAPDTALPQRWRPGLRGHTGRPFGGLGPPSAPAPAGRLCVAQLTDAAPRGLSACSPGVLPVSKRPCSEGHRSHWVTGSR